MVAFNHTPRWGAVLAGLVSNSFNIIQKCPTKENCLMDDLTRFMNLFPGNIRSFGQFVPSSKKMFSEKKKVEKVNYESHIAGKMGLGLVPILDNNKCWWGAIDIDNHGGEKLSLDLIVDAVYKQGLPLVVCRSKSGGAHCYLFCDNPLPASLIRNVLMKWASMIGHKSAEVFPKQSKLHKTALGNWINLPYFGGDKTDRYILEKNKETSLDFFLTEAESRRVSVEVLEGLLIAEHEQAPPCIQEMLKGGVGTGYRNEAIYNLTVYLKKAFPETFRDYVFSFNATIFDKPLAFEEVRKTVQSASRREYKFKCLEEPCRSNCNAEVCLEREYGITGSEVDDLKNGDMPIFEDPIIYDTDPPIWEVKVNGTPIQVNTSTLYEYGSITKVVMEKLLIVMPAMKNRDWLNILAGMMADVKRVEAPDDASTTGIIRARLKEFISKADLENNGKDKEERERVIRGLPVVQSMGINGIDGRSVLFRGMDFVQYLKRTKSEELKGSALWMALKAVGVDHHRLRVGKRIINVWGLIVDKNHMTRLDPDYLSDEDLTEEEIVPMIVDIGY